MVATSPLPEGVHILSIPPPAADHRIPYGTAPSQFGDLRLPPGPGRAPVVVCFHGGYWKARHSLDSYGHACAALTLAGFATWSVEYRRTGEPGGGWPGTMEDARVGLEFVRTLAERFPLDPERLVVSGFSAGGQLALWAAKHTRHPLRGAVSVSGLLDLERGEALNLESGEIRRYLGGSAAEVPAHYRGASPTALVPIGVRQRILHAGEDEDVPVELSERYVAAARAAGEAPELIVVPGATHFDFMDPRTPAFAVFTQTVGALLTPG